MRTFLISFFAAISFGAPVLAQAPAAKPAAATEAQATLLKAYSPVGGPQISFQNAVYRVENVTPGSFGVQWNLGSLDASKVSRFTFDWKPTSDVKVNFFFKIAGKYYAVLLTGDDHVRPGTTILGRAATTALPDGFQRVEIPLRAWLLAANPNSKSLPVEETLLGNWRNDGYLLAGIGGNSVGANYLIRGVTMRDLADEKAAPKTEAPILENNDILWNISDFAGIETGALKLRAAEQTYDLNSPFLKLESKIAGANLVQTLRFAAGDAGLSLTEGQALPLTLEGVKNSAGTAAVGSTDGTVTGEVNFSNANFKAKPTLPRLEIAGAKFLNDGDFETTNGGFQPQESIIERVPAPDRAGYALKLTNPRTASRFSTLITPSIDVAQYPALTFDYRCDDRVRLNLHFKWDGLEYSVRFLDRDGFPKDSRVNVLPPIKNAKGDGTWNSVSYNLLDVLKAAQTSATSFQIENLVLTDENWMGNARGVNIYIDNFRFVPQVPKSFKATVKLRDLSGVGAVSYVLDQTPTSNADDFPEKSADGPTQIDVAESQREAGIWYLHVRAKNNKGEWSGVSHFPIYEAG